MVTANQKTTIDKQKRKSNPNTILKMAIKSQENKRGREEKRPTKTNLKQLTYISIITLNVSGLNAPTKRHRLAEWLQKQDPYICYL